MIGEGYWSTGITVTYWSASGGWLASAEFLDDGFIDDDPAAGRISTQGVLSTRYPTELTAAVDVVKRDGDRLGIRWQARVTPTVYMRGDGRDRDFPPPEGWRELVNAQARRLGWKPCYESEPVS